LGKCLGNILKMIENLKGHELNEFLKLKT
jgi:hypothetical protein